MGKYLTALEMSSDEDEFSSKSPSSMSSGVSQSCHLSRHISFRPLSMHNKVLFQTRLLDDCVLTRLCQIVWGSTEVCFKRRAI